MPESKNIEELLIRLDERTSTIKNDIIELKSEIEKLKKKVEDNKSEERANLKLYVTKDEFLPIQRALYTIASLIITTVVLTLLSLVIQKP